MGPRPTPKLVAHDSLSNTLALITYLGAVSIRNTEDARNSGDRNPVENCLTTTNYRTRSLLPTARSIARAQTFLPYALLAPRLRYPSNWLSIYNALTLPTTSMSWVRWSCGRSNHGARLILGVFRSRPKSSAKMRKKFHTHPVHLPRAREELTEGMTGDSEHIFLSDQIPQAHPHPSNQLSFRTACISEDMTTTKC